MKKVVILALVAILLASLAGVAKIHDSRGEQEAISQAPVEIPLTPKQKSLERLSALFSQYNTSNADELAMALLLVPRDYREVLAAIAIKESNGNPNALGKVGEKGIFQVREKYWGRVPRDIAGQVLQAAYIYATLHKVHGSEYRAVKAYNGSGKAAEQYAYAVLEMKGGVR